jgi:hypothetical protein
MRTAVTATGLPLEMRTPWAGRRLAEAGCTANEIVSVRGRSPKSSVARVTPSQNWKDTRRTDTRRRDLPKPKPPVWEERQEQKKNQSEQMESGAP